MVELQSLCILQADQNGSACRNRLVLADSSRGLISQLLPDAVQLLASRADHRGYSGLSFIFPDGSKELFLPLFFGSGHADFRLHTGTLHRLGLQLLLLRKKSREQCGDFR